jgi:hypothetical protein
MSGLSRSLECPKCGNGFFSLFTGLDADETATCSCGHDFPLDDSQRAELERVRQERLEEIAEIHAGVVSGAD